MSNEETKMGRYSISRRRFIAAASTALAAPMIIPSGVLGNDKVAAANSRIGVGFIGMGKQVGGHVGGMLSRKDVQVLAVCDVDTTRREYFRQMIDDKHAEFERKDAKACGAYVDYHEMLARPDIDAVFVTTPDHWHTAIAIEACKAKKDIYCEKPLTLTIGEGKALIDAVRKHERVLQTGSQQRSEPHYFRTAVDLIRNGRIGKIQQINVAIGQTSKPCDLPAEKLRDGLDWDRWLGQAPQREYNEVLCRNGLPDKYPFNPGWRDYREYSGGHITDWGAHHFDIVQWALTMDESGPVEILPPEKEGDVFGASFLYRGSPAGDEIKVTHVKEVEFESVDKDGKKGPRKEGNGILFIGDKGKIFVNRGGLVSDPDPLAKEPLSADAKKVFASTDHRGNWIDCIASRKRPICDVEIGARSVTVCHLVNLAYWNNQKLQWDAKSWQFAGANAAEANKWIHRERRKGFELPTA